MCRKQLACFFTSPKRFVPLLAVDFPIFFDTLRWQRCDPLMDLDAFDGLGHRDGDCFPDSTGFFQGVCPFVPGRAKVLSLGPLP